MQRVDDIDVVVEPAAFVLSAFSEYDEADEDRVVTWAELRMAQVGTRWEALARGTRGIREESAEVVYRGQDGVAVLHRVYKILDSEDAPERERISLVWYQFLNRTPDVHADTDVRFEEE